MGSQLTATRAPLGSLLQRTDTPHTTSSGRLSTAPGCINTTAERLRKRMGNANPWFLSLRRTHSFSLSGVSPGLFVDHYLREEVLEGPHCFRAIVSYLDRVCGRPVRAHLAGSRRRPRCSRQPGRACTFFWLQRSTPWAVQLGSCRSEYDATLVALRHYVGSPRIGRLIREQPTDQSGPGGSVDANAEQILNAHGRGFGGLEIGCGKPTPPSGRIGRPANWRPSHE